MLLSLGTSSHQDLLQLEQQCVPNILITTIDQMNKLRNGILPLFKFIRILFGPGVGIIREQWHDKLDELVNSLGCSQTNVVLDDDLDDFEGHLSFVGELHVLHESWVVVHVEDFYGEGV
jgi:hypothetical protein